MTDDLHFFKDIHISRTQKGARFLNIFADFRRAAKNNRVLFFLFLSATVFTSISTAKFLGALLGTVFSFSDQIMIFEVVLMLFCLACLKGAVKISSRFRCRMDVSIRDSWFFLFAFNVYFVTFLPFFTNAPVLGFLVSSLAVAGTFSVLYVFYVKKIAVKKQPDLEIPGTVKADDPVDFMVSGSHTREKVQINGDTRDAFLMDIDGKIKMELPPDAKKIKFAIGVRESIKKPAYNAVIIKVSELNVDGEENLIYSKYLETSPDNNTRSWSEVSADLVGQDPSRSRHIVVKVEASGNGAPLDGDERRYCFSGPRLSGKSKPRKVILIVADAVRSDHVGCYGYGRPITPNIDSLAKDGVSFDTAFTQGQLTLPSFMSMLTGMYPTSHHVYHSQHYSMLGEATATLPEILRKNGFVTRSYFTHRRLMSHFGFAKGFDSHLFRQYDKEWNIATADDVTNKALDMLEFHKDDDLFQMIHFFDTHQPCDPPAPFSEVFDKTYGRKIIKDVRHELMKGKKTGFDEADLNNLIARYDTEISRVDMKIGILMDRLKREGHYEDAMIIVTADHGMLLNDQGSLTDMTLFDEIVKVPFIVKFPESAEVSKGVPVEDSVIEANIDIMPTVLDVCGIDVPPTVQGKSVFPLAKGEGSMKEYAISESLFDDIYSVSLRDQRYRYTFKTEFDILKFNNYRESRTEEHVFKADARMPESDVDQNEKATFVNKYKTVVEQHIKQSLDMNNNSKWRKDGF